MQAKNSPQPEEVRLTEVESIFMTGIIGCMLFATWEIAQFLIENVLDEWVLHDEAGRKRAVLYTTGFVMSITSLLVTIKFVFSFGRFGQVVNRSFLWYGALLLIITIAAFIFDYMPKVFSGFAGAALFTAAIFIVQKKFFTRERMIKSGLARGRCFSCGEEIKDGYMHCPACGIETGKKCGKCGAFNRISNIYCVSCGGRMKSEG